MEDDFKRYTIVQLTEMQYDFLSLRHTFKYKDQFGKVWDEIMKFEPDSRKVLFEGKGERAWKRSKISKVEQRISEFLLLERPEDLGKIWHEMNDDIKKDVIRRLPYCNNGIQKKFLEVKDNKGISLLLYALQNTSEQEQQKNIFEKLEKFNLDTRIEILTNSSEDRKISLRNTVKEKCPKNLQKKFSKLIEDSLKEVLEKQSEKNLDQTTNQINKLIEFFLQDRFEASQIKFINDGELVTIEGFPEKKATLLAGLSVSKESDNVSKHLINNNIKEEKFGIVEYHGVPSSLIPCGKPPRRAEMKFNDREHMINFIKNQLNIPRGNDVKPIETSKVFEISTNKDR